MLTVGSNVQMGRGIGAALIESWSTLTRLHSTTIERTSPLLFQLAKTTPIWLNLVEATPISE